MQLRAPCASAEDLTFREEDDDVAVGNAVKDEDGTDVDDQDETPTPSLSSADEEDLEGSASLSRTPVRKITAGGGSDGATLAPPLNADSQSKTLKTSEL